MMHDYQFWTLVAMLAGGFGWMISWLRSIDHRVYDIDKRLTVVETRLTIVETMISMMGFPIKPPKE